MDEQTPFPVQGTFLLGSVSGPPEVVYGSASADVTRVVITLADGGVIRAPAVGADHQKFFAFALGRGQHPVSWQAYDVAGLQTGSATIGGYRRPASRRWPRWPGPPAGPRAAMARPVAGTGTGMP
jgi:hypothetical protein